MRRILSALLLVTLPACRTATAPELAVGLAYHEDRDGNFDVSPRLRQVRATIEGGSLVITARLIPRDGYGRWEPNDLWEVGGGNGPFQTRTISWANSNPSGRWDEECLFQVRRGCIGTVTLDHDDTSLRIVATPAFAGELHLYVLGGGGSGNGDDYYDEYVVQIEGGTPAGGRLAVE